MKILVLGCGYIGSAVASLWKQKGHSVTATTRSSKRLDELSQFAQQSVILKDCSEEELFPLLNEHDLILVTIAADGKDDYEEAYQHTSEVIRHLAHSLKSPKHLMYTSSTSVYGDHQGRWVDEESALLAKSNESKILIAAEKNYLLLNDLGWRVTLFRCAGIYGPKRELSKRVKNLEHHTMAGSGEEYTNMIHKADCTAAIDYAMHHKLEGIYNLSDDEHPTRKALYDAICHQYHLPKITWDPSHSPFHQGSKRVSNHKIKKEGFVFHYPHRVIE